MERQGPSHCRIHLNPASIRRLAHFFFRQFRVQTVATATNATGSVQRTPHRTHACAHFSHCALHTCGSSIANCCESSQNIPSSVMSLLNNPSTPFLLLFFTCDFTDDTCCLTCAINCGQTAALCYFAGEGTLWPSGQLLSEHRL